MNAYGISLTSRAMSRIRFSNPLLRKMCHGATAAQPQADHAPVKSIVAMSPRVATLLEELVSLNMLEVRELTTGLKDRLGIEDSPVMPMGFNPAAFAGMQGPGAGDASAEQEEKPEKTHFDLKLEKYDAGKKIAVIKEIRAITGLGLKEAKTLVEESPKVFKNEVAKDEAEKLRDKLKEIGAEVVLE